MCKQVGLAFKANTWQIEGPMGSACCRSWGQTLSVEFGRGFEERNLRNMRAFYAMFPNWNALRSELSWTHYRLLLWVGWQVEVPK